MTKQRAAIEAQLQQTDQFRSAQQLHEDLKAGGSSIGLATVYRTLQALADQGAVDTHRTEDGEQIFRLCNTYKHHHHLICRKCAATVEISSDLIESWVKQMASEYGYADVSHSADLTGICSQCQASETAEKS